MSQIIENRTLIYEWDEHRKTNYYCQFATVEELNLIKPLRTCLTNNKNMQHTLPDGTKTFPYAPEGPKIGFILKCGNFPYGNLTGSCSRYVYTNCSYTCGNSDVVHTATCNLMGPWTNVTTQWSFKEPCVLPKSTSQRIPLSFHSNASSHLGLASIGNNSGGTEDTGHIIVGIVVAVFVLVLGVVLTVCFLIWRQKWKHKQQPECPAPEETQAQTNLFELPLAPPTDVEDEDVKQSFLPDLATQQEATAFTDLDDRFSHYNYAENNTAYKGLEDKKLIEALFASKLDVESLDKITVGLSGTMSYSKPQNGFVDNLEMCNATVELLKEQAYSYRKRLRAELEVIDGRSREQALIGYMEENARALDYMPNEIKLLE
ncbi:hypothetical protein BsWGS_17635 [Bradybaena similaris]